MSRRLLRSRYPISQFFSRSQEAFVDLPRAQHRLVVALCDDFGPSPTTRNALHGQRPHPWRQNGVVDRCQHITLRFQAEQGADAEHRRRGGPRLRETRRGVLDGVPCVSAIVSREDFRQTRVKEPARFKDTGNDGRGVLAEPVAGKPRGDEVAVVRPDRPVVILDGVVPAFTHGHGANPPSGEHPWAHQVVSQRPGLVVIHNAAPQQEPDVRAQAVDFSLVAVEGQSEEPAIGDPEILVEPALQLGRLRFQFDRERFVLPDFTSQTRATEPGIVGIALELAGRAWRGRQRAVVEQNGIPGVLPALVLEAEFGLALVLDVAIAVAVPVSVPSSSTRRARWVRARAPGSRRRSSVRTHPATRGRAAWCHSHRSRAPEAVRGNGSARRNAAREGCVQVLLPSGPLPSFPGRRPTRGAWHPPVPA